MFSASKVLSAPGRGAAQASASSNDYRVVLPRLPTGKLVVDSVFLHADLSGRPYRAQDFRDALRNVIDLKEISSIGQFQMSHVWMVTCKSGMTKSKLVARGELFVKGRRCVVIDPEPTEVQMKLLWLPERLEDDYIRDTLQAYGKVKSISAESCRVSEMEQMRTLNRDVVLTLADGVSVGDVPHLLSVFGVQSLVLIPGRPPLCLRCNRVGHIRRNCRTPRCETCRRFGHTSEECVVTYADKLRHRTKPPDESLQEHIMDITEVLDATGDVPSSAENRCASKAPLPVKDSHNGIAELPVKNQSSEEKDDQPKQQPKGAPATTEPAAAQQANEGAGDDSPDAPKRLDTPYRVEHVRDSLARLYLLPEVVALGPYQMSHLWAVTFKDEEGKRKILEAEAFNVKDHRCMVIDPRDRGVRLKLYWLLHGVPDEDVRVALAPFGKVTEISRDKWKVKGCIDKGSTTRSVTLKLNVGLTVDDLPHQLRVAEDMALVFVPGRAPLCLRCRGIGHIRRE
ncbi:uncharacterized protein LOC142578458 [Dermacentor variabilis]|uniref:uncharacterized protein LOC142578458 n=1 Tax=Dermacentor variabilis TaxID=34621 RepID=UPI003F5B33EF